jgi:hypothetical protein
MNEHTNCHGQWSGLGFRVLCYCKCHNLKNEALKETEGARTGAGSRGQSYEEDIYVSDD